MLRGLVKLILFPVNLFLSLLTLMLSILFGLGKIFLYTLMGICLVVGFFALIHGMGSVALGAFILAFLLGPLGIPLVGALLIKLLKGINKALRSI